MTGREPGAGSREPERAGPTVPARVKGLSLVSLLNDFASEMVYPLLPAFITRTLGGGALALGTLDGAADLTAALLRAASGRWADRPGWQRPLILAGYAIATVVRPLMAWAAAAWQVVAARVVDRIGKGLRSPARDALIAGVTAPEARGRAFGFHRAADHFGAVAGSLAAWLLLSRGAEVRTVLAWSIVPGVVAMVVLMNVLAGGRAGGQADRISSPVDPPIRRSAEFWVPVSALTLLTVARIPETLLLLRLQDLGVAVALVPLAWAALHVVRSLAAYPGGWLSDQVGPRATLAMGALLFAAAVAMLGRELSPAGALGAFLGLGLVSGLTEASDRHVVASLAVGGAGRAFGNAQALAGIAALPAGIAFGAVFERAGGPVALRASAAVTVLALVVWLLATRRVERPGVRTS